MKMSLIKDTIYPDYSLVGDEVDFDMVVDVSPMFYEEYIKISRDYFELQDTLERLYNESLRDR